MPGRRSDRSLDGFGDVVQLQIEEHVAAELLPERDDARGLR